MVTTGLDVSMSTRRMLEPVTTMVSRDWFFSPAASCAIAVVVPAAATAPSDKARRTADDSLFTSSLITLSNVRVVYNRFGTSSFLERPIKGTPKTMAVVDSNNIFLTWESLLQTCNKRLKSGKITAATERPLAASEGPVF